jgi:uncharacterized membrane protein
VNDPRRNVALELTFAGGLVVSAAALLLGLLLAQEPLLRLGVLALIATPPAATVMLALGLASERDWLFAAISLWVLLVLASSLSVALRL